MNEEPKPQATGLEWMIDGRSLPQLDTLIDMLKNSRQVLMTMEDTALICMADAINGNMLLELVMAKPAKEGETIDEIIESGGKSSGWMELLTIKIDGHRAFIDENGQYQLID